MDHILLSSAKSINLNSVESVNIDTKDVIIQTTGKIYLADKNASQQALLGNKTTSFLTDLVTALNKVAITLSALVEILPPTPQVPVNQTAAELISVTSRLLPQISSLLSTDVYIKDNGIPLSIGSSQTISPSEEAQIRSQDTTQPTNQPITNQPVSQSQTEPEQDLPPASPDTRT
jgi:hypothetical protein